MRLAQVHGIDGAARILNHESGLLALGGASDMRRLVAADTPEARFAVDHFCYWMPVEQDKIPQPLDISFALLSP